MKTSVQLFIILLLLLSMAALATPVKNDSINLIESKHKNLFVFKVDKSLIGGEAQVYHSDGELVTSMQLKKRKSTIDFCDSKFGQYTIKIIKDGKEIESYTYSKMLILSSVIR